MKINAYPLLLALVLAGPTHASPGWLLEPTVSSRVGFDSNPIASGGTAARLLGDGEAVTYAAGASFALALAPVKLTYAGETVRFDGRSGEDFSTHRLGLSGQAVAGAWKFTGEGSSLFIDGSRATLLSAPTGNANSISLWRERRRQWQHRAKVQTQAELGAWVVRSSGTLLAYDYQTRVVAGSVAFADRYDAQGALEAGWKQSANSLWLAGVRAGHQAQSVVPLPNCAFDYSNGYHRLSAGWEGKPVSGTTVTIAAGPDFRHYSGTIDPRVFLGGRDRTSLWFESGFSSKLSPTVTLTGRAVRMDWLSSTGKSAYLDSCAETACSWTANAAWTWRLTAKVHRCDYFPTVRDDWESFCGAGATWKFSKRIQITADLLRHRGWNELAGVPERDFRRVVFTVGASVKL